MSTRRNRYPLPYIYQYRNYRSSKYSNETVSFNTQLTASVDAGQPFPQDATTGFKGLAIVPATTVLGNRKVKNFTIKITANFNDEAIMGALVYVPEGTEASNLLCAGPIQSLYEPNQNVIATFIIPPNCVRDSNGGVTAASAPTQITVTNKLARNLNTGDCIVMIFASPNGLTAGDGTNQDPPLTITGTVNFAIKY